jgi:threonine dehydratase
MFNRLLSAEVPGAGVVAASGGNAGLAVAFAALTLGHRATVFVPVAAPDLKVARLRGYGADVRQVGASYAEALAASESYATDSGALVAHAYDQPEVVAGQGTLARELERQTAVDTILVAVGGGGLIAGVAGWFADRANIVAVEPFACPTLSTALQRGRPVDVEVGGRAADSLGAGRIGEWCWAGRAWIDEALLVTDEQIVAAQRALWEACRIVAEPGGATAAAALLAGAYQPHPGERVAALVCGGNTDPATVASAP